MKRIISLRSVLLLLMITGGAKLVIPLFEDSTEVADKSGLELFNFVAPVFAAKTDETSQMQMVPQQCETPEEIFLAIDRERDLLSTQKTTLEERRASVSLAAEKLKQETERLSGMKRDLESLFARVERAKSADLTKLVAIYRGMKPKDAANIMNTLDIEVTVMVLAQMKERDASPIFAKLNLVRSQAISKIILERSKLPGDQDLNGILLK